MHYYQFNIGDYSSHTQRLSIYEDIAYRRLLDLYYLSEQPFNGCSTDVAREIGMLDSLGDVEYILNKFLTEKNGEWSNKRCDAEIKAFKDKKKTAKKAGIASGVARRNKRTDVERTLNTEGTDVEPNIKHKPITINHKPTGQDRVARVPYQDILNLYHESLSELPQVKALTQKRKGYIKNLWADDLPDMKNWTNFFDYIKKSDFLMGKTQPAHGRTKPFMANLEWITKPENFLKILEETCHG